MGPRSRSQLRQEVLLQPPQPRHFLDAPSWEFLIFLFWKEKEEEEEDEKVEVEGNEDVMDIVSGRRGFGGFSLNIFWSVVVFIPHG